MTFEKWVYLGVDPVTGKRLKKHVRASSQSELNRKIAEAVLKAKSGSVADMYFKDYAERWMELFISQKSAATQTMYLMTFKKFEPLYYRRVSTIKRSDIQFLIAQNTASPKTCINIRLMARQVFESAIDDGLIERNPATKLSLPKYRPKERRPLTEEEKAVIPNLELAPMDKFFVTVLLNFGLRPEEARALTKADFDFDSGRLTIDKAYAFIIDGNTPSLKETKTGAVRRIPIPKSIQPELENYIETCETKTLIHKKDGYPMTKQAQKLMWNRITNEINKQLEAAGYKNYYNDKPRLTPYNFRHNYGTTLYYRYCKTGQMTFKYAAYLMGHSENMFISRYTHLVDGADTQDIEIL